MKGTLIKLDRGWHVKCIEEGDWETYYPIMQSDFDIENKQNVVPLVEGKEVEFTVEKYWETGIMPFDMAVIIK